MVSRRSRILRRAALGVAAIVVLAGAAFLVWALNPAGPEQASLAAALEDEAIEVTEQDGTWVLRPADGEVTTGVVFLPGARVQPAAYVPTWAPIVAETGVQVVIPRVPLNLAVLARGRPADVIAAAPTIDEWYVGGHSLGGAMATSWLGGATDAPVAGVILWGSYPTQGAGLDARPELAALSVGGTRDGLSTVEDLRRRADLLPPGAQLVFIEGMNHAQFGRYGAQRGDGTPTIDDAAASDELTRVTAAFLTDAP
ncbi:MAG: hypothetical protein JJT89_12845 [Nitriliruptoraceae bacterium]|nr:hypothetical protein [Nitriliruptoraceae bacterium]